MPVWSLPQNRAKLLFLVFCFVWAYASVGCGGFASPAVGSSGSGSPPTANLGANPATLTFGNVTVGTTSTQKVVLTNTGQASLTVSAANLSGSAFSITGLVLPLTLAPGQSTSVNVSFAPTSAGNSSGSVSVVNNGPVSPVLVSLSGVGIGAAQASLSPTSLSFGSVTLGNTASQTVTLTNNGGSALNISAISSNGDFTNHNNCPSSLAAGGSCSLTVTFTPTVLGSRTGTLSISDDASSSPQQVALSGTGVNTPVPGASLSSGSVVFGSLVVNTTSAAQAVTLTNTGNAALTISGITSSGDFAQTNNCPASLAANASCTINLTFTPTALGTRSGTLSVSDNASGSPQQATLSGSGVSAPAPAASLTPTSLSFGNQVINTTSTPQSVSLKNTGSAALSISGITSSGDFAQTNNCPASLAANASCTINLTFTPTALGSRSGTLSVSDNASGSPQQATLSGSGVGGILAVAPTNIAFGSVLISSSVTQNLQITNTGTANLTIFSANITGSDFSFSGLSLPLTLNPSQSTSFGVTFTPSVSGAVSGSLAFVNNGSTSPVSVGLSGTGITPQPHWVDLNWNASTSTLLGYNVYRGTQSGGPYSKINSVLEPTTSYTDTTVTSGQTYFYVVTAVDANNNESGYSNEAKAVVPTP